MPKLGRSKSADRFQNNRFSPFATKEDISKAMQKLSRDMMKQIETTIHNSLKDVRLPEKPKKSNEKEGLLRFPFRVNDSYLEDYSATSKYLHFANVGWYLRAKKPTSSDYLSISFHCNECFLGLSFKTAYTVSLLGTTADISRTETFCFKNGNMTKNMLDFISWNELVDPENGFVDGKRNAVLEVKLTVNAFAETGSVALEKNFFFKHDAVLLIGGRRVGVNKGLLSASSSYFNVLFNGKFCERNQSEIVLEDVGLAEFIYLLDAIYDASNDDEHDAVSALNVDSLLLLADRFDVQKVIKDCEHFLKSSKIEMGRKLVLAQEFRLAKLQAYCFKHYKSSAEYKQLRLTDHFQLLTDETKIKLLENISECS